MAIDAKSVAQLREMTGAGMMAAKSALAQANGDMAVAAELLRKSGAAKAAKRAGRSTSEGLVYSYVHGTQKLGVLLELQCETDFVARNEGFKELAHQLSMHIAAADPQYVDVASVPQEVVTTLKSEFGAEAAGKPAEVVEKIVGGKMDKWFGENVLLRQPFVMDEEKTIEQFVAEVVAKLGENIRVSRFARFNIQGGMRACEASEPVTVK